MDILRFFSISLIALIPPISILVISTFRYNTKYSAGYISPEIISKREAYVESCRFALLYMSAYFTSILSNKTFIIIVPLLFWWYFREQLEKYKTARFAESLDSFCLYLRPFSDDNNQRLLTNGHMFDIDKVVCSTMSQMFAPIFAIGLPNKLDNNVRLNTLSIYTSDDEWQDVVSKMIQKAEVVYIHISDTPGCLWELQYCLKFCINKTIFYIDSAKSLTLFESVITDFQMEIEQAKDSLKVNHSCIIFRRDKEWTINPINRLRDIKKCLKQYNKKYNLKDIIIQPFKTKTPYLEWYMVISVFMQPLWYLIFTTYRRLPDIWWIIVIGYFLFISFFIPVLLIVNECGMLFWVVTLIILYIPYIYTIIRLSCTFNTWGSFAHWKQENKTFASLYIIFFALLTIFTILTDYLL